MRCRNGKVHRRRVTHARFGAASNRPAQRTRVPLSTRYTLRKGQACGVTHRLALTKLVLGSLQHPTAQSATGLECATLCLRTQWRTSRYFCALGCAGSISSAFVKCLSADSSWSWFAYAAPIATNASALVSHTCPSKHLSIRCRASMRIVHLQEHMQAGFPDGASAPSASLHAHCMACPAIRRKDYKVAQQNAVRRRHQYA